MGKEFPCNAPALKTSSKAGRQHGCRSGVGSFESLRELPPEPEVGLPRPISKRLPSYHFAGWLNPLNVCGRYKEHIISGVPPLTLFGFTMRCASSNLLAVGVLGVWSASVIQRCASTLPCASGVSQAAQRVIAVGRLMRLTCTPVAHHSFRKMLLVVRAACHKQTAPQSLQ